MARVTVKNRRHASLNPNAHLRKVVTIDDVIDVALHLMADEAAGLLPAIQRWRGDGAGVRTFHPGQRNLDAVWITGVGHCGGNLLDGRPHGQQPDGGARRRLCARAFVREGLQHGGYHRSGAARCMSPSCTRRSATPNSMPSTPPAGVKPGEVDREAARRRVRTRRPDSGEPVGRHAVHQCDRGDRQWRASPRSRCRSGDAPASTRCKGARLGIASGNGGDHQIFGTMVIEA